MFTKGKKIVNPIFEDSCSQAHLVFIIRYLCFIAFLFLYVVHFIFEWKINFIKGLHDLGESGCSWNNFVLNHDSLGYSYFNFLRSGPTLLLFHGFAAWLDLFSRLWQIWSPHLCCAQEATSDTRGGDWVSRDPLWALVSNRKAFDEVETPWSARRIVLYISLSLPCCSPIVLDHRGSEKPALWHNWESSHSPHL